MTTKDLIQNHLINNLVERMERLEEKIDTWILQGDS